MQCPGQDSRYWDKNAIFEIKCQHCGQTVEFFKDDSTRTCKHCGHRLLNPSIDFGCASYCPYAEQCLGGLPPGLLAKRTDLLKDRVAIEMKRYFGDDFRRIGHASRVARFAEAIGKEEKANLAVVLIAAYLHDIGIKEAERKFQSSAAHLQHQEGPPVAREILTRLNADPALIEEVCDIVGHHHNPRSEETTNFKALYDADVLVNLEESHQESPIAAERINTILEHSFLTVHGRQLAKDVFGR